MEVVVVCTAGASAVVRRVLGEGVSREGQVPHQGLEIRSGPQGVEVVIRLRAFDGAGHPEVPGAPSLVQEPDRTGRVPLAQGPAAIVREPGVIAGDGRT